MGLSVVILAAGNGKRMYSSLPKVLHPLGGIPLLLHVIQTAKTLHPDNIYVVHGNSGQRVKETLRDEPVIWVEQIEPKGTGHALLQALPHFQSNERILVLYGDVPLITTATLQKLLASLSEDEVGLLVASVDNPTGFGRIIRNQQHDVVSIVEHRDATEEQLCINEINTGILTVPSRLLKKWLPELKSHNAQSEYYLTDIISLAVKEQVKVVSVSPNCTQEVSGVNDRRELMVLERYYQREKANALLTQGVMVVDVDRFDCRGTLEASKDVTIDIDVIFEGEVTLGEGTKIGSHSVLKNVRIGKNVIVRSHCVIEDAVIADNCIIGPFARIRPNCHLKEGVHVGNFVELKNTEIAEQSKVNHLTYLGDAVVGKNVNVGAGTITCNYDGFNKYTTIIEDGAFIGSGTELVAPLVVGEKAYIGAGSTITKDAPSKELTLGRAKQVTVKGWKKGKKVES